MSFRHLDVAFSELRFIHFPFILYVLFFYYVDKLKPFLADLKNLSQVVNTLIKLPCFRKSKML